jgi:HEAT repeat protein
LSTRRPWSFRSVALNRSALDLAELIQSLNDRSREVKIRAIRRIARMGQRAEPAVAALARALADGEVRLEAVSALKQLGSVAAPAVPKLVGLLNSGGAKRRGHVIYTLGAIGAEAVVAVPALQAVLEDGDWSIRAIGAYALGQIGSASAPAIPRLKQLVQSDTADEVVAMAALALAQISPKDYTARSITDAGKAFNDLCRIATEVVSDKVIREAQKSAAFAKRVARQTWPAMVVDVTRAAGMLDPQDKYSLYQVAAEREGIQGWSCAALATLIRRGSGAPHS